MSDNLDTLTVIEALVPRFDTPTRRLDCNI